VAASSGAWRAQADTMLAIAELRLLPSGIDAAHPMAAAGSVSPQRLAMLLTKLFRVLPSGIVST
jgi:hypothetical protein